MAHALVRAAKATTTSVARKAICFHERWLDGGRWGTNLFMDTDDRARSLGKAVLRIIA